MVIHCDDVPWEARERGPLAHERVRLASAAGSVVLIFAEGSPTKLTWLPRAGVMLNRLCPLPLDTGDPWEREAAAGPLDLSSPGPRPDHVLALGDFAPVHTGSVVARPAGTGVAHAFEAGDGELVLLAYGTRRPENLAWYPDSGKIALRGLGVCTRVEPVDYWDGEDGG